MPARQCCDPSCPAEAPTTMKFETAFAKAWGRDPTSLEIERVRRVCDAFEVRDNDALLSIAGLLQFYDGNYRQFGGQLLNALDRAVRERRRSSGPQHRGAGAPSGQRAALAGRKAALRWAIWGQRPSL